MKSNEMGNALEVEKIIGYKFKSKKLLKTAITHSSYSNEHKVESNEKLEFLGDAVIELIITEILFRDFVGKEGDLSKIRSMVVSEKPFAEATRKLGIDKFLLKGVGESKNTTKSDAMKCDMFEAICGAIFVDGGIEEVKKFFNKAVGENIENLKKNGYDDDPKTKLQELKKYSKIVYSTTKTGSDHSPVYKTTVFIDDKKFGSGTGSSKKQAEEHAAAEAIKKLNI